MVVLETINLCKKYRMGEHNISALAGIELKIHKGEFTAIMGPSGSGKSTLLHMLGGLDTPTSGEVVLSGVKLSSLNEQQTTLARRHHVGFIFQFFNLLPTLTAEENIVLPLVIDNQNVKTQRQWIENLLQLVGLAERRSHKPDQLSGGEQQRVAIARALVTHPDILLADEPTGNLDTKTGTSIMDLLLRSRNDMNQTVIVVTHDPKAAAYSDRVVFLRDGIIVEEFVPGDGTPRSERLRGIVETMEKLESE